MALDMSLEQLRLLIREELEKLEPEISRAQINSVITERFQRIGLFEQDDRGLIRTRLNFSNLENLTNSIIQHQGAFKRGLMQVLTPTIGNVLWAIMVAGIYYIFPLISHQLIEWIKQ